MILCDQLCAGTLEIFGGPVRTPNLARIASRGVAFEAAYCQAPICSPSRASILTGRYPHTHGLVGNVFRLDYPAIGGPDAEEGIDSRDITTEGLLAAAGYDTRYVGKWHVSGEIPACYTSMYREHQEYAAEMKDFFYKVESGPRENYVDWYGWKLPVLVGKAFKDAVEHIPEKWQQARLHDFYSKIGILDMPIEQTYDDRIAVRCIEAIRQAKPPFMLTCSFNMPHDPNVVPARYYDAVDPAKIIADVTRPCEEIYQHDLSREIPFHAGNRFLQEFLRVYEASIMMVDDEVGRILAALEEKGVEQDTVILFTSDHGDMAGGHGMFWKSTSSFYDEITRVPLLVSAPGCPRGIRYAKPVELVDLMPTILELCGAACPAGLDGESLVTALLGKDAQKQLAICERLVPAPGNRRIRRDHDRWSSFMLRYGNYKYVIHHKKEMKARLMYDLENDPHEYRNLIGQPESMAVETSLQEILQQRLATCGYTLDEHSFAGGVPTW